MAREGTLGGSAGATTQFLLKESHTHFGGAGLSRWGAVERRLRWPCLFSSGGRRMYAYHDKWLEKALAVSSAGVSRGLRNLGLARRRIRTSRHTSPVAASSPAKARRPGDHRRPPTRRSPARTPRSNAVDRLRRTETSLPRRHGARCHRRKCRLRAQ